MNNISTTSSMHTLLVRRSSPPRSSPIPLRYHLFGGSTIPPTRTYYIIILKNRSPTPGAAQSEGNQHGAGEGV